MWVHRRRSGSRYAAVVLRTLLSFMAIGLALFVADRALLGSGEDATPVVVTRERVDEIRATLLARIGREPDETEIARLIRAEVDDELLIRAARSQGFDLDDPVILRRLVQNMRFAGADPERSDADLFDEAVGLGMHRTDPVVRRRLVQRMRLLIEAQVQDPSDEAVRLRWERDREDYVRPERIRMTHLYFEADHADRAAILLEELVAGGVDPGDPAAVGEAFLLPSDQPLQSRRELGDRFGADFAARVFGLPDGRWSGPVPSAYGVHLVWVREREPTEVLPFDAVRDRVRYGLLAERRAEVLEGALAGLRARTPVRVADGAGPG